MEKQLRLHKRIKFLMKFSLFQTLIACLCFNMAFAIELVGEHATAYTAEGKFLFTNLSVNAIIVTGRIVDETGAPMPGVNILIKGTTTGTATDVDGKYSISVPDENAVLVISFIGYTTEELTVGTQTVIDYALTPDIESLSEVIVVGYGTQKKAEIIGSVSTVNTGDLNIKSIASFDAGLQGLAAGVSVQTGGGQPGAPTKILIRGIGSISSSTDPLFVLDGMPIYNYNPFGGNGLGNSNFNPMATINQNDIESIQVLKDAAATSIYGSRGSNGVIIITTKKGKLGEGSTTFNYSTGITSLTRTPTDAGYANAKEWFQIMDSTYAHTGSKKPFDVSSYYGITPSADKGLTNDEIRSNDTNWFDKLFSTGSFSNYNLATSRGFDKGALYISGNYRKDQSVQNNSGLERFSIRSNVEVNPSKSITLNTRLTFSYTKNRQVPTGLAAINSDALPWLPVYKSGTNQYFNATSNNAVANNDPSLYLNTVNQYRGLGGVSLNYKVPFVKGLAITSEVSTDIIQSNVVRWTNKVINRGNNAGKTSSEEEAITYNSLNYNAYANYNKVVEDHSIELTGGAEATRTSQYSRNLSGNDLVGAYQEIGTPRGNLSINGRKELERNLLGIFARANYSFKGKYLLGLSGRRDGTTAFTKENRWANFYAVSAGWIISEENFMSFLSNTTFIKLRGSYGETGNQNVPTGLNVVNYNTINTFGQFGVNGTAPRNIANANLKWETTRSADVGIDYGIFGNRINGSVAYYHRIIVDMLLPAPLASSAGVAPDVQPGATALSDAAGNVSSNQIWMNVGSMVNSGFEFEVHSTNINSNGFKWTTDFNISFNKNKILNLTPQADASGQGITGRTTVSRKGHKRREWYTSEWAGVDPETGVGKIYKLDVKYYNETGETRRLQGSHGDSLINATQTNKVANLFHQDGKSADPTYYGGITNTLSYKSFDLSFMVAFSGGNYILDYDRSRATIPSPNQVVLRELATESWHKKGDVAKYPQLKYNSANGGEAFNDRELYKGDYIRLRNIQLGYTLSKNLTQKFKIQGLRFYVSASNLFTRTKYPGYDPEGAGPRSPLSDNGTGVTYYSNAIPQLKSYNIGVDVKF